MAWWVMPRKNPRTLSNMFYLNRFGYIFYIVLTEGSCFYSYQVALLEREMFFECDI